MAAKKSTYSGPTVVRDPERTVGDYIRILQQTTGGWFVYDDRRRLADKGVPKTDGKTLLWKTMEEAVKAAFRMEETYLPNSHAMAWGDNGWTLIKVKG